MVFSDEVDEIIALIVARTWICHLKSAQCRKLRFRQVACNLGEIADPIKSAK